MKCRKVIFKIEFDTPSPHSTTAITIKGSEQCFYNASYMEVPTPPLMAPATAPPTAPGTAPIPPTQTPAAAPPSAPPIPKAKAPFASATAYLFTFIQAFFANCSQSSQRDRSSLDLRFAFKTSHFFIALRSDG